MTRERERRTTIVLLVVFVVALFALATIAGPALSRFAGQSSAGHAAKPRQVTLKVGGSTCSSCASSVKSLLAQQPGVIDVTFNQGTKEAVVRYDGARTTARRVAGTLSRSRGVGLKYTAKVLRDKAL